MMGFIFDFVGGMGDGMAKAGQLAYQEKATRERDEANYVREQNLETFRAGYRSEEAATERDFRSGENEKTREFESEQKKLDRESSEREASMRSRGDHTDRRMLALDDWYRERLSDIDDMEAKGEIGEEQAAAMRMNAQTQYHSQQGIDDGKKAKPGKAGEKPGGANVPPAAAIDRLKANDTPAMRAKFDEVFGTGAAERAIGKSADSAAKPESMPTNDNKTASTGLINTAREGEKKKPESVSSIRSKFDRNKGAWSRWVGMPEKKKERSEAVQWLELNMQDLTVDQREIATKLLDSMKGAK